MRSSHAKILLASVFIARGTSFLFSKALMQSLSPFSILGVRFTLAFLILGIIFHRKLFTATSHAIRSGLTLGVLYTICMTFEMYGLRLIDTGVSSLIENMAIVLVPLYVAVLTHTLPQKKTMLCALLAVIGVGFLSVTQTGSNAWHGILLMILAAMTYAVCIIYTERVSHEDAEPITIGMIQLGTMGICSLCMAIFTGGLSFPQSGSHWLMMLMLILVCSCFGFAFQPVGQKYVPAETAAVFTVVNPLTASILGIIVVGEKMSLSKTVGYVLILTALLLYNMKLSKHGGENDVG